MLKYGIVTKYYYEIAYEVLFFNHVVEQEQISKIYVNRALADMDLDGRLGSEEFVLAMHLCDIAKAGENIPTTLPLELIPPTFRRQRQSSLTLSQNATENIDPLAGMPQV